MREEGYYWVKEKAELEWIIGYFHVYTHTNTSVYGGHWTTFPYNGSDPDEVHYDHELEIDEVRITRDAHIRVGMSAALAARKVMKETEGKLFGLL